jgi:hypothetical protein
VEPVTLILLIVAWLVWTVMVGLMAYGLGERDEARRMRERMRYPGRR